MTRFARQPCTGRSSGTAAPNPDRPVAAELSSPCQRPASSHSATSVAPVTLTGMPAGGSSRRAASTRLRPRSFHSLAAAHPARGQQAQELVIGLDAGLRRRAARARSARSISTGPSWRLGMTTSKPVVAARAAASAWPASATGPRPTSRSPRPRSSRPGRSLRPIPAARRSPRWWWGRPCGQAGGPGRRRRRRRGVHADGDHHPGGWGGVGRCAASGLPGDGSSNTT